MGRGDLNIKKIRQGIKPGNSKSFWKPVSEAMNLNGCELPEEMLKNSAPISKEDLPEEFARYFVFL